MDRTVKNMQGDQARDNLFYHEMSDSGEERAWERGADWDLERKGYLEQALRAMVKGYDTKGPARWDPELIDQDDIDSEETMKVGMELQWLVMRKSHSSQQVEKKSSKTPKKGREKRIWKTQKEGTT